MLRENVLAPDELLVSVFVPAPAAGARQGWAKLKNRQVYDFAVATQLGRVRLCGAGAHEHGGDGAHLLLAIDGAGDDRGFGGAAASDFDRHAIGGAIATTSPEDKDVTRQGNPTLGHRSFPHAALCAEATTNHGL